MTSSFARLLGASPSNFSLQISLRLKEQDLSHDHVVAFNWTDAEEYDAVVSRMEKEIEIARKDMVEEKCQVDLKVERAGLEMVDHAPECRVQLTVEIHSPMVHSLELIRTSGSAVSEVLLKRMMEHLRLEEVRRLKATQGFAFFFPGLVDVKRWADLQVLNLNGTGIGHLPEAVGLLTTLRELRLSNNRLTTLPRSLGKLANLRLLVVDRNQLVSIPGELCDCISLEELNMESNKIMTPVLDLKNLRKLKSLQLYDNPLEYLPELSICEELRSLSFTQLRVWSDRSYSKFEVEFGGSSVLSRGGKLAPLFALLFRRTGSQHPLVAGALSRISEHKENCQALVKNTGGVQQILLMALSDNSSIQLQAAKVIAHLLSNSLVAEELVEGDILTSMLALMKSDEQEIQLSGLKVLSTLALTSDSISSALLTPDLLDKLQGLISNAKVPGVQHLGLEVLGNLGFPSANKSRILGIPGLLESLINLADASSSAADKETAALARRALAILGQHEQLARIVGRGIVKNRGIRILAMDGGGMKGIAAVMLLKEIERRTGKQIADLFDLIGGTSTGAMLAAEIGLLNYSLDKCSEVYKTLGSKVFSGEEKEDNPSWKESFFRMYRSGQQGMRIAMTGCKHDPTNFEELLESVCSLPQDLCQGNMFIDSACLPCPKVFAVATLSSVAPAVPFLFRNYEFPPGSEMLVKDMKGPAGASKHMIWQGVRASSAAPYFLDDYQIGDFRFQDGATTANNPAAIAVQQARLLWPDTPIDCVVSIGVGCVPVTKREKSSSLLLENGSVLIESACSVDRVDEVLSAVLPMVPGLKYYRFSAVDPRCDMSLDSVDPEAWSLLEAATTEYIASNQEKLDDAAGMLAAGSKKGTHGSETKAACLGSRKGLVIIDAPLAACGWVQDVVQLCTALPNTISHTSFDSLEVDTSKSAVAASVIQRSRQPSLSEWTYPSGNAVNNKDVAMRQETLMNSREREPLSKSLESIVSPRQIRSPSRWIAESKPEFMFRAWGESSQKDMPREGYHRLHSTLLQFLEECGIVHLAMSTCEGGARLVTKWKTTIQSVAEPSPEADNLLALLAPKSSHQSLLSLFNSSRKIWLDNVYMKCLSMQETETSTGHSVRSFVCEKSEVWETMDVYDVAAIGNLWKGMLVTTTAYLGDEIIQALINARVLGILFLSQDTTVALESAVALFREFHKQLRLGSSLVHALDQAEQAQSELVGVFKLVLP